MVWELGGVESSHSKGDSRGKERSSDARVSGRHSSVGHRGTQCRRGSLGKHGKNELVKFLFKWV